MKTTTYLEKVKTARVELECLKAAYDRFPDTFEMYDTRCAADAVAKAIDDLTWYIARCERIIAARNEAAARAVRSGGQS